jgi:hypothetical protein
MKGLIEENVHLYEAQELILIITNYNNIFSEIIKLLQYPQVATTKIARRISTAVHFTQTVICCNKIYKKNKSTRQYQF